MVGLALVIIAFVIIDASAPPASQAAGHGAGNRC